MPHTMAAVTTVPKKPFGKPESIQREEGCCGLPRQHSSHDISSRSSPTETFCLWCWARPGSEEPWVPTEGIAPTWTRV